MTITSDNQSSHRMKTRSQTTSKTVFDNIKKKDTSLVQFAKFMKDLDELFQLWSITTNIKKDVLLQKIVIADQIFQMIDRSFADIFEDMKINPDYDIEKYTEDLIHNTTKIYDTCCIIHKKYCFSEQDDRIHKFQSTIKMLRKLA